MKKTMKKLLAMLLALSLMLALTACGGNEAPADDAADGYKIAIVQQLDHASLDEIRLAIEAELDAIAEAEGIEITYDEFNGQNDSSILSQIGSQVVDGGYDAVIPIATLAAQTMATAVEADPIPVVYAAASDPVSAGLTGIDYVTGTSDALNTAFILEMMLLENPDLASVGLLYSKSETNSALPIQEMKDLLDAKGITYVEKTGNTTDEVLAAVGALVGEVEAIFTPTDNVVMAAELAFYETLTTAGIPHYTGADSFVRNGAFTTCGVNYTDLGTKTAQMAMDVLKTGEVPEYHVMEGGIITVNTETAQALGIDYSVFASLDSVIVEVQTSAE